MRGQEGCMQRGCVRGGVNDASRSSGDVGEVDGYGIPGPSRERGEIWHQGEVINPERGSRETARLTATFTSADGDLLE
jgi:hypothetical protein